MFVFSVFMGDHGSEVSGKQAQGTAGARAERCPNRAVSIGSFDKYFQPAMQRKLAPEFGT